jgi:hypothetical protein
MSGIVNRVPKAHSIPCPANRLHRIARLVPQRVLPAEQEARLYRIASHALPDFTLVDQVMSGIVKRVPKAHSIPCPANRLHRIARLVPQGILPEHQEARLYRIASHALPDFTLQYQVLSRHV